MTADGLPTWSALCARCWALIVQWCTPLAPTCLDCGFPIERNRLRPMLSRWQVVVWHTYRWRGSWGDGAGRCLECAQLLEDANELASLVARREALVAYRNVDHLYNPSNDRYYVRYGVEWSAVEAVEREIAEARRSVGAALRAGVSLNQAYVALRSDGSPILLREQ